MWHKWQSHYLILWLHNNSNLGNRSLFQSFCAVWTTSAVMLIIRKISNTEGRSLHVGSAWILPSSGDKTAPITNISLILSDELYFVTVSSHLQIILPRQSLHIMIGRNHFPQLLQDTNLKESFPFGFYYHYRTPMHDLVDRSALPIIHRSYANSRRTRIIQSVSLKYWCTSPVAPFTSMV